MSSKRTSLERIIEAGRANTNDGKFVVDFSKLYDLKTANPKSPYDCTYLPISMLDAEGKTISLNEVWLRDVPIASGAKRPPPNPKEKDIPKAVSIMIRKFKEEEIPGGDYVPQRKDNAEEQEKENERVEELIKHYYAQNAKMCEACEILDRYHRATCEDLIEQDKKSSFFKQYKFRLNKNIAKGKDKKAKDPEIINFGSTGYQDEKEDKFIDFDSPHYKLNIPVVRGDGRIGRYSKSKEFKPIVFDVRRSMNGQPSPAVIRTKHGETDLDINNVSSFITFKSIVSGSVDFGRIVVSKMGLSLNKKVQSLYVLKHKSSVGAPSMTSDEMMSMTGGVDYSKQPVEENEIVEVKPKPKKSKNGKGKPTEEEIPQSDDESKEPKDEDSKEPKDEDESGSDSENSDQEDEKKAPPKKPAKAPEKKQANKVSEKAPEKKPDKKSDKFSEKSDKPSKKKEDEKKEKAEDDAKPKKETPKRKVAITKRPPPKKDADKQADKGKEDDTDGESDEESDS